MTTTALTFPDDDFRASQTKSVIQDHRADAEQATDLTNRTSRTKSATSGRSKVPPVAITEPRPTSATRLADPFLYLQAQVLDDLERTRIANENRLRQLTRNIEDSDGEERGFGLDESHPDVARLAGIVAALAALEHGAELNLKRALRAHPLGPWVKGTVGVGDKQGARLLAAIGDPYWNTLYDRPRTVSELWAFSGLHVLPGDHPISDAQRVRVAGDHSSDADQRNPDTHRPVVGVAAKRRKGQKSNWSGTAKMRAYLVATSCIKHASSPYRAVYDARRAHALTTHADWSLGHSHNDALRIVSKAILKDLWLAARAIHGGEA